MSQNAKVQAIILSAGRGTRMKSPKSKVLHRVAGKPLVQHTLTLVAVLSPHPSIVVVNNESQTTHKLVKQLGATLVIENTPQGTGSTIRTALPYLKPSISHILVLNSDDSFLYRPQSIYEMLLAHIHNQNLLTFLTTIPSLFYQGVKKVIRNSQSAFVGLDYSDKTNEVVCGAYVFDREWLTENLPLVKLSPIKNEYLITDLLLIALEKRAKISPHVLKDPNEWWGVNTKEDLKYARKLWRQLHHES